MGMKKKMRKVWESLGVDIEIFINWNFLTILKKFIHFSKKSYHPLRFRLNEKEENLEIEENLKLQWEFIVKQLLSESHRKKYREGIVFTQKKVWRGKVFALEIE